MSAEHSAGISRNTLIFVAASLVQAAIALVTVPAYLSVIGEQRFGVYVIALLIIGYFGLSDLGLGTAAENEVARLGDDEVAKRSATFWTATTISAVLGVAGSLALLGVSWPVFSSLLSLPEGMRAEALDSLPVLAACIPLLTFWSVFHGVLNGRERFVAISVIDTGRLTLLQLLPLGLAYWQGAELVWLATGFLVALVLSTAVAFVASLELALAPQRWARPSRSQAVSLLHFGKWVTLTGFVSPLLTVGDRVILGALRGATAVTVFSIPYNLASRLLVIPFSLIRVAFPRFSSIGAEDARALGASALAALAAVTAPLAVLGATVSPPFLEWWIGEDLATDCAPVAAILFAGIWLNGLGHVPYSLLQAQGRPHVPALYHTLELVPFLIVLAVGVELAGPVGAALAWSGRALVDSALLLRAARLPWFRDGLLLALGAIVILASVNAAVFSDRIALLLAIGLPLTALSLAGGWMVSPPGFRSSLREALHGRRQGGRKSSRGSPVEE